MTDKYLGNPLDIHYIKNIKDRIDTYDSTLYLNMNQIYTLEKLTALQLTKELLDYIITSNVLNIMFASYKLW